MTELSGDLRSSHYYPVLSGVLSTRMKLKTLNHAAENLIQSWAEPFSAFAMLMGKDYNHPVMLHLWKILLQNHGHDSICGCCIDEVAEEILVRYEKAKGLASMLKQEALSFLLSRIRTTDHQEGKTAIVVFNPLNHGRDEPVTFKLTREDDLQVTSMTDYEGNGCIVQMIRERIHEGTFPHSSRVRLYERDYVFIARVPQMGYTTYYAMENPADPGVHHDDTIIENEFYRVKWHPDNHLTLYDLKNGRKFFHVGDFIDEADCGDEYNFSPLQGDRVHMGTVENIRVDLLAKGPVEQTLQITGLLRLPAALAHDRKSRSIEHADSPFILRVSVYHGLNRIDFSLHIDNHARDHRLRVLFPTVAGENLDTEFATSFGRRKGQHSPGPVDDWIEKPSPAQPQGRFAIVKGDGQSAVLFNSGLPEIEISNGEAGCEMKLTLLRSIGWLSRHDITGRAVEAGPKLPTPEAQNLEKLRFNYSFAFYDNDIEDIPQRALSFDLPLESMVAPLHDGEFEPAMSFLSLQPEDLILSATKRAERNNSLIVRFYNPTSRMIDWALSTPFPFKGFYFVNLNEERQGELQQPGKRPIGPGKIISIELVGEGNTHQEVSR